MTLASRYENVDGVDLMHLEVEFLVLLPLSLGGVLNDGFFTVDYILIQLMRQHSLHWLTFKTVRNFLNGIRHDVRLKKQNKKYK